MDSLLMVQNVDEFDVQAAFQPYTVISLLPFKVETRKPGIRPFVFNVPPKEASIPGILIIRNTWRTQQFLTPAGPAEYNWVPEYPKVVAESIVNDFSSAQLVFDAINHRPGIFCLPGALNVEDVIVNHDNIITEVAKKHRSWCLKLVEMADADWNRDKNRSMISDLQVYAAKELSLDREWVVTAAKLQNMTCPACTRYIPKEAAICPNCRCIIDPDKASKLTFAKEP